MRGMSTSVDHMDTSLADAKTAIDSASTIAHSVATSMYGLRDAMSISIFGAQPLIGLAGNFDSSGQSLDQLGNDIATIGTALDANRTDVTTTSQNLSDLADSVHALTVSVQDGPSVAVKPRTLDAVRLAVYAVTGWLIVFALGCLIAGIYLINATRVRPVAVAPTRRPDQSLLSTARSGTPSSCSTRPWRSSQPVRRKRNRSTSSTAEPMPRMYSPAPMTRPTAATAHMPAAVVSPRIRLRMCRIVPAPRKPMPVTICAATRAAGSPGPKPWMAPR